MNHILMVPTAECSPEVWSATLTAASKALAERGPCTVLCYSGAGFVWRGDATSEAQLLDLLSLTPADRDSLAPALQQASSYLPPEVRSVATVLVREESGPLMMNGEPVPEPDQNQAAARTIAAIRLRADVFMVGVSPGGADRVQAIAA